MDKNNLFLRGVFSKFSWYWGAIVGLSISSLIVFAATNFIIFNPGTNISSSEMNSNFQIVKDRIDEVSYGVAVGLSADQTVLTSSTVPLQLNVIYRDDAPGAYDPSNFTFTVQPGEGGYFTFYFKSMTDTASGMRYFNLSINGISSGNLTTDSTTLQSNSLTKFLADGDTAEVTAVESFGGAFVVFGAQTLLIIKRDVKI